METPETFQDLCDEIGCYTNILNLYIKVFDIRATIYKSSEGLTTRVYEMRTYTLVTPLLIQIARKHKSNIVAFHKDYYRKKTIQEISAIINRPADEIKNLLKTEIFNGVETRNPHSPTNINMEISDTLQFYKISSFEILRRLQRKELESSLIATFNS